MFIDAFTVALPVVTLIYVNLKKKLKNMQDTQVLCKIHVKISIAFDLCMG